MRLKVFIMCFILSLGSLCAFAQGSGRTVTGTVQDAKGNPLVGAVVMQPGSSNGAVTDADGTFSINVSGGGYGNTGSFNPGLCNQDLFSA